MLTDVYIGCYTTASPVGVHALRIAADGTVTRLGGIDAVEQASFLTVRPDTATLYAVSETVDAGTLVAIRIGDGALETIDEVPSHGAAPCHVSTHADRVYVANYASGTVAGYELRPDGRIGDPVGHHRHDGSGPHPRQAAPHAHCIVPGADGTSVYAADLGTDRIMRYERHPGDGSLSYADETPLAPGSGPRHLALHPTRPLAYVVCELDNTLVVADIDPATDRLHPRVAVSTLPDDAELDSIAAEVVVHPGGERVYVSNRGHDSIATFAVDAHDAADPRPELVGHVSSGGRTPRHIAIHPTGHLLLAANQDSDTVVAFEFDDAGVPRSAGVVAEVSQPVCVAFAEVGS